LTGCRLVDCSLGFQ